MQKELCSGSYRAEQVSDYVILHATGVHPTPGYRTYFEPYRMLNTFALVHERPTGIVPDVITPFNVSTMYYAAKPVETVLVIDATGKHEVRVEQTSEQFAQARGGGDSPGPFILPELDGSPSPEASGDARTLVINRQEGVGYSDTFSIDEAIQGAVDDAAEKMPPNHVMDSMLTSEVVSIGTEMGGIAGLHRLVVRVLAKRMP